MNINFPLFATTRRVGLYRVYNESLHNAPHTLALVILRPWPKDPFRHDAVSVQQARAAINFIEDQES